MIINKIPTKIQLRIEDESAKSGEKLIETEVICITPMMYSSADGSARDAMLFMSIDKDGKVYGNVADDVVKIIETREYGQKETGGSQHPFKKKSRNRRKKNRVRDNNTEHKGGDKSKGGSDSGGGRNEEQADGSK